MQHSIVGKNKHNRVVPNKQNGLGIKPWSPESHRLIPNNEAAAPSYGVVSYSYLAILFLLLLLSVQTCCIIMTMHIICFCHSLISRYVRMYAVHMHAYGYVFVPHPSYSYWYNYETTCIAKNSNISWIAM